MVKKVMPRGAQMGIRGGGGFRVYLEWCWRYRDLWGCLKEAVVAKGRELALPGRVIGHP